MLKHPALLHRPNIPFGFLPLTKDIWAVDYMPIQVNENYFVQFKFAPGYYRKHEKHLVTDPYAVWDALEWKTTGFKREQIKLDGGNIVKGKDKVIITTQVFSDVRFDEEMVWLSQEQMDILFGKASTTINKRTEMFSKKGN
jgi:agmatine deiminase